MGGSEHREEVNSMRTRMWEKIIRECPEYSHIAESLVNQWFNAKVYGCVYDREITDILNQFESEILESEKTLLWRKLLLLIFKIY